MDTSTANVVMVQFRDDSSGAWYSYWNHEEEIRTGDMVVVPVHTYHKFKLAQVTAINVYRRQWRRRAKRWIVGKVDLTKYEMLQAMGMNKGEDK